jgi:integrase
MTVSTPIYRFTKRKNASSNSFTVYVKYRLPDGTYTKYRSTGTRSIQDATKFAEQQLFSGTTLNPTTTTFKTFAKNFFDWDGEWALDKRSANKRLSKSHCARQQMNLDKHVIPVIGNLKLSAIDTRTIKMLRIGLSKKGLSGSTINHVLISINAVMNLAEEMGLIERAPKIHRVANKPQEKGILDQHEFQKLYSLKWSNQRARVATLIAHLTGFRMGEVLGLRIRSIHPDSINLVGTWQVKERQFKDTTKNGSKGRNVPIPPSLYQEIQELIDTNPWKLNPDAYLFYSTHPNKPIEHNMLVREFYAALKSIGIDKQVRTQRNLSFHSARHMFNTSLIEAGVPMEIVGRTLGHLDKSMSVHYFHGDHVQNILSVQSKLIEQSR